MSEHGSGRWRSWGHSQPGERTVGAALTLLQESVELGALFIGQSFGEESEDLSLRARHCLRTEPFDDCHRRQDDQPFPKFLHNRLSENNSARGLQGRGVEPRRDGPVVPGPELLHSQSGQQLKQMASPRRIAFRVDLPRIDRNPELPGDYIEKRAVRPLVTRQHSSWKAEIAHQYRNAEPVVVPTMLTGKGQINLGQRVQANKLSLIRWEGEQFKAL
jgi:hypothetical protein